MRAFSLLATIYAATVATTSGLLKQTTMTSLTAFGRHVRLIVPHCLMPGLVDVGHRTTVDVTATGYDPSTSGDGCSPDGCIPENTRDNSRASNSRWSCWGRLVQDNNNVCCITYRFEDPQDIVRARIALHNGNALSVLVLDVYVNGNYHSQFESSGTTLRYQGHPLFTEETEKITFCLDDEAHVLLGITEGWHRDESLPRRNSKKITPFTRNYAAPKKQGGSD